MKYKGYLAKVKLDDEAGLFHGEIAGIRDVVTFQGRSLRELKDGFRDSVDDYLEFCKELGREPEKPCSGKFVVRVSPDVHRRAAVAAEVAGLSLNAWVAAALKQHLEDSSLLEVHVKSNGGSSTAIRKQGSVARRRSSSRE